MEQRQRQRIFLGLFFFLAGFCFATWTSRIPTIKIALGLNEAELGTILLFMPFSSLVGLPISGWLVSRFDSRGPLTAAFVLLSISLLFIGYATSTLLLVPGLCLFSFATRILNISANTQAVALQQQFQRKIVGAFHGLWSTGGIVGVGFCTWMVAADISIDHHLLLVSAITLVTTAVSYRFLLRNDRAASGNKLQLSKPDPYIVCLGLIVFLAAICEGGMFDWSGVYFREVVKEELFTMGYLLFMIFMALSRFASDRIVEAIGMPKMYVISALFIGTGIGVAVLWPAFWPSLVGFCLVGLGVAAIIPMTYILAAASRKYSPSMAMSVIATYSIAGVFLGPPMIGYIAHASGLRIAFVVFALAGLLMIPVSQYFFRYQRSLENNA